MFRRATEARRAEQRVQEQREELLRPPSKTNKEKFRDFFWDQKAGTCLTRSPINWISITIYYTIFLLVVLLIFYFSLLIVMHFSGGHKPQYLLSDSLLGDTPGLNYFPLRGKQPLIWISNQTSPDEYIKEIEKVFETYKNNDPKFNTEKFGDCGTKPFGYDSFTPCIYFRLNRVLEWVPGKGEVKISCEGSQAKDQDHITEEFFEFPGSNTFDPTPYPFTGQDKFVDSIIAMKIVDKNPKKVVFAFKCTAESSKFQQGESVIEVTYYFE